MNTITLAKRKQVVLRQHYQEAITLSRLAVPLILSSLVSMSISITDVIMMGWLGPMELAAGAAVSDYYSLFFYFTAGIVAAVSPMMSQARGAKQYHAIRTITQQGLLLALLLSIPGAFFVFHADVALRLIGIEDVIVNTGAPYGNMMAIAYFVVMAVSVLHHLLSSHDKTRMILVSMAFALPVNILGNYTFMFGNFGVEAMGLAGAGLASILSALTMLTTLSVYIWRSPTFKPYRANPDDVSSRVNHIPEIFRVGLPIGISNLGEMGVFLLSTVTMGIFGAEVLAAHTVALRMAGVVYAIPLGFAQAATVRVGYTIGAGDRASTRRAIRTALVISLCASVVVLIALLLSRESITHAFLGSSVDEAIMMQAAVFLFLLALSQPFDNLSCVGAGILRGHKDTRKPMLYSVFSFWAVSFAGGWSLAFFYGMGGLGIWIGLAAGSIAYGVLVGLRLLQYRQKYQLSRENVVA